MDEMRRCDYLPRWAGPIPAGERPVPGSPLTGDDRRKRVEQVMAMNSRMAANMQRTKKEGARGR